jgi:cold shock CspA family protein/ribosome-associated translation inhibitor RaiA
MIRPVQIICRNLENSQEAKQWVQEEAAKLDRCHPRITSCRVALEVPHAHRELGRIYRVQVDVGLPGRELVVRNEPTLRAHTRKAITPRPAKQLYREKSSKDLHLAIQNAFKIARRRVSEYARRRRGEVKPHEGAPIARVLRTVPERGFGFLESLDGREIYFHRNAVVGGSLEQLQAGTPVEFREEPGIDGPHATVVKVSE